MVINMKEMRLETTFAVGSITVNENNIVVSMPPIFRWMLKMDYDQVCSYYKRKGKFVSSIEI